MVVELAIDPARFRAPEAWPVEPWTVGARFEAWLDRLHFLVWANTYDAREGEPGLVVGPEGRAPGRAGHPATARPTSCLADGRPAWIDGGPRAPLGEVGGACVVHADAVETDRLSVLPPPRPPTAELAPDQLAAVAHGAGPARVIAPAGSGKTRVLTERLRHLHVDRGYERDIVLAVAYNKRAQQEMEERTTGFRPRVQTLNALGYSLLAGAQGRPPGCWTSARPASWSSAWCRPASDGSTPTPSARTWRRCPWSASACGTRPTSRTSAMTCPAWPRPSARIGRPWPQAGVVDFDEQIYGAVELLLHDGELRRRAQSGCRHLLVDELQDLTPAHVLLLRLLATPALDVFGVGDDDQVIYGHAGADPAFLLEFGLLFPGAVDHPLEVNYRCPVAVVDAARHLLSYNRRRVDKVIRARPRRGPGARRPRR